MVAVPNRVAHRAYWKSFNPRWKKLALGKLFPVWGGGLPWTGMAIIPRLSVRSRRLYLAKASLAPWSSRGYMDLEFLRAMTVPAQTKIVLLIMDGLSGLPLQHGGK